MVGADIFQKPFVQGSPAAAGLIDLIRRLFMDAFTK
jgi:hypothetical protein